MKIRLLSMLLAGTSLALIPACSQESPTELVAGMTTQMQVPKELHSVGVVVQTGGRFVFCDIYPVADGLAALPSTLGLYPADGPGAPVTLSVLGFRTPQPLFSSDCLVMPEVGEDGVDVIRRRRSPYVPERILYMPMPLKHACVGVDCLEEETCVGGQCRAMDLDPSTLPDFREDLIFGTTNTCFSVEACIPPQASLPARLLDPTTCLFQLESPPGGGDVPPAAGLNVRILHENFTPEVLDLDIDEGFVIPDPDRPLEFSLAPALCQSRYQQGRILGVWASPLCPSKTPYQPLCANEAAAIQSGDANVHGETTCVSGGRLRPTESALYVVMDRSKSMDAFFGEAGLREVLNLSLQDPVFERARVALSFLPAAEGDCGASLSSPNPFASPSQVGFLPAADARLEIAEKVGERGNLLSTDPDLFLDAALSEGGAYAALATLANTPPSTSFNRRALLVLTNRDLWTSCPSGQNPAELASAALSAAMHTYVVLLRAPAGTDFEGRDPASDAAAIAAAGGTEMFDARSNPEVGAVAMQSIISELGSCIYDPPDGESLSGSKSGIKLSYFNPSAQMQVIIDHDSACSESVSGASGWNLDSEGRVLLCGSSCDSLRAANQASAAMAALAGLPAPLIPIHVNVPCPSQP